MKPAKSRAKFALVYPFLFLFSSCLGLDFDIRLNENGSGTLALEYRISKEVDALGRLDGNERWNTVPVGRADFERSLDRLPEIKLVSFTSKEDDKNLIINAKMEFTGINGLLAFLDAGGRRSVFAGDAAKGSLKLVLSEGAERNANINKLIAEISESYAVKMSMTFPGEGSLALSDSRGNPLAAAPGGEIVPAGETVSVSIPLYEVLSASGGIGAEFRW